MLAPVYRPLVPLPHTADNVCKAPPLFFVNHELYYTARGQFSYKTIGQLAYTDGTKSLRTWNVDDEPPTEAIESKASMS